MAATLPSAGAASAAPMTNIPVVSSSLDPTVVDIIIRSRNTLLDILDERGYDVSKYRYIAPDQILTLAEGHPRALDIIVPKKADGPAPCERAVVVYQIQDRMRTKMGMFAAKLYEKAPDAMGANLVKPTDDVIVILNEPYNDIFDKTSLQLWQTQRSRLVFFHIKQVVVHPGRHMLVPPHRKLSAEEAADILERYHVSAKTQLPLIKHHDIQARVLGLVPGDIVEVLRPSPTSGILKVYRICAS
jgi:DNA-directed RNA polymerase subunit H (RpoH/RPB5)